METLRLGQRIRALRKEHGMTQELLAQALGVTAGAVYKWEAGLSAPDLRLLVALADFFDTSVDALLGYTLRDNRQSAAVERLLDCLGRKDPKGLQEAELALVKHPNAFSVVHTAARLYFRFGMERRDRRLLERARALTERSLLLLNQNRDPQIGEVTLRGELAKIEMLLGNTERGLAIMKEHNVGGIFSADLGYYLAAECERPDEAMPFLSEAMQNLSCGSVQLVFGWLNVFLAQRDDAQAEALLHRALALFSLLSKEDEICFLDKIGASLRATLAYLALRRGDRVQARAWLTDARSTALRFDAAPSYRSDALRYVTQNKPVSDDLGATAAESVERLLREELSDMPELQVLWREVCNDGEG